MSFHYQSKFKKLKNHINKRKNEISDLKHSYQLDIDQESVKVPAQKISLIVKNTYSVKPK